MTGALHVSGGVFVLALLTTLGGAGVVHALYRLRRREWRTDDWWGNRRWALVVLVSAADGRTGAGEVRTVRRATDVVRALETIVMGTLLMMLAVAAGATAIV